MPLIKLTQGNNVEYVDSDSPQYAKELASGWVAEQGAPPPSSNAQTYNIPQTPSQIPTGAVLIPIEKFGGRLISEGPARGQVDAGSLNSPVLRQAYSNITTLPDGRVVGTLNPGFSPDGMYTPSNLQSNLVQVRRGNEGIIQVSRQAFNETYAPAGFKEVSTPPSIVQQPAPTDIQGLDTTGLPSYMVEVLSGIQALADQMKAQGKRVNPDITIDDATVSRFLEQAKSELGPYYRQQFQQTESDLKLGFQRLKEDQAKRELALSKQYGTELERTQESYAQRGLDFSTQRDVAEKRLAEGYSSEIEKGITEAARAAEDLGTKGERVLGSVAYPSVDTSIRTGTTPGLGQPGVYGFNFGTQSRSLFNPVGGQTGTLERDRLFAEEKRKTDLINAEREYYSTKIV